MHMIMHDPSKERKFGYHASNSSLFLSFLASLRENDWNIATSLAYSSIQHDNNVIIRSFYLEKMIKTEVEIMNSNGNANANENMSVQIGNESTSTTISTPCDKAEMDRRRSTGPRPTSSSSTSPHSSSSSPALLEKGSPNGNVPVQPLNSFISDARNKSRSLRMSASNGSGSGSTVKDKERDSATSNSIGDINNVNSVRKKFETDICNPGLSKSPAATATSSFTTTPALSTADLQLSPEATVAATHVDKARASNNKNIGGSGDGSVDKRFGSMKYLRNILNRSSISVTGGDVVSQSQPTTPMADEGSRRLSSSVGSDAPVDAETNDADRYVIKNPAAAISRASTGSATKFPDFSNIGNSIGKESGGIESGGKESGGRLAPPSRYTSDSSIATIKSKLANKEEERKTGGAKTTSPFARFLASKNPVLGGLRKSTKAKPPPPNSSATHAPAATLSSGSTTTALFNSDSSSSSGSNNYHKNNSLSDNSTSLSSVFPRKSNTTSHMQVIEPIPPPITENSSIRSDIDDSNSPAKRLEINQGNNGTNSNAYTPDTTAIVLTPMEEPEDATTETGIEWNDVAPKSTSSIDVISDTSSSSVASGMGVMEQFRLQKAQQTLEGDATSSEREVSRTNHYAKLGKSFARGGIFNPSPGRGRGGRGRFGRSAQR